MPWILSPCCLPSIHNPLVVYGACRLSLRVVPQLPLSLRLLPKHTPRYEHLLLHAEIWYDVARSAWIMHAFPDPCLPVLQDPSQVTNVLAQSLAQAQASGNAQAVGQAVARAIGAGELCNPALSLAKMTHVLPNCCCHLCLVRSTCWASGAALNVLPWTMMPCRWCSVSGLRCRPCHRHQHSGPGCCRSGPCLCSGCCHGPGNWCYLRPGTGTYLLTTAGLLDVMVDPTTLQHVHSG
jgi:hypothetical protein